MSLFPPQCRHNGLPENARNLKFACTLDPLLFARLCCRKVEGFTCYSDPLKKTAGLPLPSPPLLVFYQVPWYLAKSSPDLKQFGFCPDIQLPYGAISIWRNSLSGCVLDLIWMSGMPLGDCKRARHAEPAMQF